MKKRIVNPRLRMFSLDDFEDEPMETQKVSKIEDEPITHHMIGVHQLLKGSLSEEQANELLNELRKWHHESWLSLGCNKNLHEHIDYEAIFYTCRIIAAGERDGASNLPDEKPCIEDFDKNSYRYWMWALAQQMPIWMVKPEEMPKQKNNGTYPPEWFGYYDSNGPRICLCSQRIKAAIKPLQKKGIHIDEKLLYAYVIIHLLAHAVMDASNRLDDDGKLYKYENKCQRVLTDDADILMEESIANMIALSYFASFMAEAIAPDAKMAFDTVKEYMSIQPMPYKFGLTQFYLLLPDWRMIWRRENKHFF